jgi:hypothetical protein
MSNVLRDIERLVICFTEKHNKIAVLITYVTQGQILARVMFKPLEPIVVPICAERPLRRLLIRSIEKHHKIDVLVKYVTLGKILARSLLKPTEPMTISIVLAAMSIAMPTNYRDNETFSHHLSRDASRN